jgi:uncharacterized protein
VGSITATRTTEGIYIQGQLESSMSLECVRCLDEAIVKVNFSLDELFYYPPHIAPAGEHRVGEDGMIDLAPLVRELSLLSVPDQGLVPAGLPGFVPGMRREPESWRMRLRDR